MKLVLAANSQGTDAGVEPGQNYPELVRAALAPEHQVDLVLESGWTVREFADNAAVLIAAKPDLVVLQVGIVECARRILSPLEKRVLAKVPGGSRVTKVLHDHRPAVIRMRQRLRLDTRVYDVGEFDRELARLRSLVEEAGEVFLPLDIPGFAPEYAARHFPLVNEDIELFNGVLRRFGSSPWLVDEDPDAIWQPGTVHFTAEGHRRAAQAVVAALAPVIRSSKVETHA